jgi:hypothetical protein
VFNFGSKRARSLFIALTTLALIALAACGGGDDPTATSPSGSNPTPTSSSGSNNPTATTSTGGGFADASCNSISLAAGIAGDALEGRVTANPDSDSARDLSEFFEDVLDEALGGVTAGCFYEIETGEGAGVWIAYELDGSAPANPTTAIADELVAQGAERNNVQSFSGGAGGQTFAAVAVTGLNVLDGFEESGAYLYLTGDAVVLIAASDTGGSSADPTATLPAGSATATRPAGGPTATAGPGEPPASDLVAAVDAVLRPALNEAIDTTLTMGANFSATVNGVTTIQITYSAAPPVPGDIVSQVTEVVEALGGTVDSSVAIGGTSSVNISGTAIGDMTVTGSIIAIDGSLTVTLQAQ